MKNYIVVWECNNWASHYQLKTENRHLIETHFNNCYHLADLFNSINEFLETFKSGGFYPEVITIKEI